MRKPTSGQLDTLLGYQLRRASAAMTADFASALGKAEIRPTQFAILSLVEENDGISQSELCRALSVQKANMTPLILELERRGLLARKAAPSDRRVQMLTLTDEARHRLTQWRRLVATHEARFFGVLDTREQSELLRVLDKLWGSEAPETTP